MTDPTVREQLLAAIDDTRCEPLGYAGKAELLAAYDASRTPADRAAVLREIADALGRMDYDTDSSDYGYDTYRDAWNGGVMDGAALLRRVADETAATETQTAACPPGCVACATDETHDPAPAAGARQDGAQR